MPFNNVTGYFYSAIDGIRERLEAGPPAISTVELSPIQHDFKPTTNTNIVLAGPYGPETVRPGIGVKIHHTGGGMHRIKVPFHARRYTRGDAEKYLYDMLTTLGRSDLGELCVHGAAYTNCWFLSGEGEIVHARINDSTDTDDPLNRARFHVKGQVIFARSLPPTTALPVPSLSLAPPERIEFISGSNNGDYTGTVIDGPNTGVATKIGRFCDLTSLSVQRPVLAVPIPRCDGVRIVGRGHTQIGIASQMDYRRGRSVTMRLRGHVWAYQQNDWSADSVPVSPDGVTNPSRLVLEKRILALQVGLRGERLRLTGNGNTFQDCYLTSLDPDDDGEAYSTLGFTATFEHELNEVSF